MDRAARFQTGDTEVDHANADAALLAMFKDLIQYAPAGVALQARQLVDDYEASRDAGWWYA
jgi:hypothetical protein